MSPAEVTALLRKHVQDMIERGTIDPKRALGGAIVIERGVFVERGEGRYEFLRRKFAPGAKAGFFTLVAELDHAVMTANCLRKLTDAETRTLFAAAVPIVFIREGEMVDVTSLYALLGQRGACS